MTRLTNAFSKSRHHLECTVALHITWYNFFAAPTRPSRQDPSQAPELARLRWAAEEIVARLEMPESNEEAA